MLTLYNAGNAAAIFLGAILGAIVIQLADNGRTAYLAVFAMSSVGRALALVFIPHTKPTTRRWEPPAGLRTIAVRPMTGSMERPIIPTVTSPNGDIAP